MRGILRWFLRTKVSARNNLKCCNRRHLCKPVRYPFESDFIYSPSHSCSPDGITDWQSVSNVIFVFKLPSQGNLHWGRCSRSITGKALSDNIYKGGKYSKEKKGRGSYDVLVTSERFLCNTFCPSDLVVLYHSQEQRKSVILWNRQKIGMPKLPWITQIQSSFSTPQNKFASLSLLR